MDTEHIETPSAEELAAEQAASVLPKEEEVRSRLAEELGLDAEDDADKEILEKVVKREMDGRKKLSDTIRSKISWRTKATKKPGESEQKPPKEKGEEGEKDLSTADFYALQESEVPYADLEEVKKASKLLGVSIPDALKDDMVQSMLKRRQELRASANAADPGTGGRGNRKGASDQEILEKARGGDIPKPGTPEAEALFRARRGTKPRK